MYRFLISTCEIVLQFNDNAKTQYNEGKGYQRIRTVKTEFENIRSDVKKNVAITEKKLKQYIRQIKYTNHYP